MCKQPEPIKTGMGSSLADAVGSSSAAVNNNTQKDITPPSSVPTHSATKRNTKYDVFFFLGPAVLFYNFTNVLPIYAIALTRLVVIHAILSLHYQFVDFDNYHNKLSQKQIWREKEDYQTAFFLHMWIQVALQIVFPSMFFSESANILPACLATFLTHVLLVEPLYYFVHRWLHVPAQMKSMHGFHHLSINTLPTTALVQNFQEHLIYVVTFGPAFFFPFFVLGRQHWVSIGAYLVLFDIVNTYGHTNWRIRHTLFHHKYSPLKYLLYTPEFHLGHHAYFNANYTLFMPIWDYLFGTARPYAKKDLALRPSTQQDFVFIGHNGGLGHLLTIPELCVYNVFDDYKLTGLPIKLEFLFMHGICQLTRLFRNFYYCSRNCIANEYIGRIIVLLRTPYDYLSPKSYAAINQEILQLMREQHAKFGTRYFGLGNLNKMKQLNDGGIEIANMIAQDEYLHDKKIRVWTGDTMTVASVYHQIADIPDLDEFFYIGAGGKVGTAVCQLLTRNNPNLKIRIFSRNQVLDHPNITYSNDLREIRNYRVVLVGKMLSAKMYANAFAVLADDRPCQTRFVLDYTVPALPIVALQTRPEPIQHIRVGLLQTPNANNPFLKGQYDWCMSHPENHIVPCHFGCLLNTVNGRETDEVGDINLNDVDRLWRMTLARGFDNIAIKYDA